MAASRRSLSLSENSSRRGRHLAVEGARARNAQAPLLHREQLAMRWQQWLTLVICMTAASLGAARCSGDETGRFLPAPRQLYAAREFDEAIAATSRPAGDTAPATTPSALRKPEEQFTAGTAPEIVLLADEERGASLTAGLGMMKGHTTYRIGGTVEFADGSTTHIHFPISELEFPLEVVMATLRGRRVFSERWDVEVEVNRSITADAGKMKDSDFGLIFGPTSLDVYSESDADLDALIVDSSVGREFRRHDRSALDIRAGLRYENFSYEISNADQWYPSVPFVSHQLISGVVLTYDVTYIIPYVELKGQYAMSNDLRLSAGIGYSPFVTVSDEDSHLARSPQKFTDGEYDGSAVVTSLRARYALGDTWFWEAGLKVVTVQADGSQDTVSGSDRWTIDAEVDSSQVLAAVVAGRRL